MVFGRLGFVTLLLAAMTACQAGVPTRDAPTGSGSVDAAVGTTDGSSGQVDARSCAGYPCGTNGCPYGSGCVCGGQPCVSSGCPVGTGCIP